MKTILKIIALATLTAQLYANIPDDIKLAIRKSKIDLLKTALEQHTLSDEQKNECIQFANKISNIREDAMKSDMINPKKLNTPGSIYQKGAMLFGALMGFEFLTSLSWAIRQDKSLQDRVITFTALLGVEAILALITTKLWTYGKNLNVKVFEKYRSPKQKYLVAFEINQILAKL